ncbi:hypothetical protein ASPBRDRAFT_190930 [Aspergillus brasiliensis CBS 101740]|uniref:Uncharacterized protein n=1 Tax=Aspergillus brasiliensis (strain CBS 101740 / IMI 381727 / IBT 21946) TaxID=767769 RepID=A0A1L9V165_ASPBC|nr:hypothetical protein ASPBRDRAFT_190930 [Aspergillus brasiliensis CBS 101740]
MEFHTVFPSHGTAADQSPDPEIHTDFRRISAYEAVCDICDQYNMQTAMSQCVSCGWRECRACTIRTGGRRSHKSGGTTHFSQANVEELIAQEALDYEDRVARIGGWSTMRGRPRLRGYDRGRRYHSRGRRGRGGRGVGRPREWERSRQRGYREGRPRFRARAHRAAGSPSQAASSSSPSYTGGRGGSRGARAPETADGAEMLYALGLEDSAGRRSESGSTTSEEERRSRRATYLTQAKRAREDFETQRTG